MVRDDGEMKAGLGGILQDFGQWDASVVGISGMKVDGSGVIKHER
jgi:hypothetical protein